ncbi:sirohydrochlorin chelatase [Streptomyces morookaense]|uniref:Sirohydrochlorin chelatase n=1 Tax=Streptomyces morookaense TaxID=1970 RepID=A0A7Y7E660_STRMO|nr:CbiX/SirB N-terminal domain-containing protein [Streptomyces morookaense]NVK77598.1 sirohydrochlorin chelatase [Streptomyces morookaense]
MMPLLAVVHGTRDPQGTATTAELLRQVARLRPEVPVRMASVDTVREALTDLGGDVVLVPLLLGAGYHVRTDIPRAVAAAPRARVRVGPPLGPHPLLAVALEDRLAEAGASCGDASAVVLAAAGSTDPAANAAARATARLLSARLGRPVMAAFLHGGATAAPSPAAAVASLRKAGHADVAVARYLLAPGWFARRAEDAGGCATSAPLGAHEAVAQLVWERYDAQVRAQPAAGSVRASRSGAVSSAAPAGTGTAAKIASCWA